jgi:hypothetical protein
MSFNVGNQVLAWNGQKNLAGLNQLMESPPLVNWISNDNTDQNKL